MAVQSSSASSRLHPGSVPDMLRTAGGALGPVSAAVGPARGAVVRAANTHVGSLRTRAPGVRNRPRASVDIKQTLTRLPVLGVLALCVLMALYPRGSRDCKFCNEHEAASDQR